MSAHFPFAGKQPFHEFLSPTTTKFCVQFYWFVLVLGPVSCHMNVCMRVPAIHTKINNNKICLKKATPTRKLHLLLRKLSFGKYVKCISWFVFSFLKLVLV